VESTTSGAATAFYGSGFSWIPYGEAFPRSPISGYCSTLRCQLHGQLPMHGKPSAHTSAPFTAGNRRHLLLGWARLMFVHIGSVAILSGELGVSRVPCPRDALPIKARWHGFT
jgi:hypothetical protein